MSSSSARASSREAEALGAFASAEVISVCSGDSSEESPSREVLYSSPNGPPSTRCTYTSRPLQQQTKGEADIQRDSLTDAARQCITIEETEETPVSSEEETPLVIGPRRAAAAANTAEFIKKRTTQSASAAVSPKANKYQKRRRKGGSKEGGIGGRQKQRQRHFSGVSAPAVVLTNFFPIQQTQRRSSQSN